MRPCRLLIAVGAAAMLLMSPASASATEPAADPTSTTAPYTTTLNIPGTTIVLTVEVSDGQLSTVNLDSGGAGAVMDRGNSHTVTFDVADNTTHVQISARHDKIETRVSAASIDALVGQHVWEGELFGPGAGTTRVTFGVTDEPSISGIAVQGPGTAEIGEVSAYTDDDETGARVQIELTLDNGSADNLTASITIKVEVEDDDGEQVAKLKIGARSELIPASALSEAVIDGGTPIPLPQCDDGHVDDHEGRDGYDDEYDEAHHDDDDCDDDDHDDNEHHSTNDDDHDDGEHHSTNDDDHDDGEHHSTNDDDHDDGESGHNDD